MENNLNNTDEQSLEEKKDCSTCEFSKPVYPMQLDYCIKCGDTLQNFTPITNG